MDQIHLAQTRTYQRLSKDERIELAIRLSMQVYKQCEIAAFMKRPACTISREIKRGGGKENYLANHAHELAQARMRACATNARRIAPETWAAVEFLLALDLSPEQIWLYLRGSDQPAVSPEWIYQRIYAAKATGGLLHCGLRCQKTRRKRYGSYRRRGVIANAVSIDQRPAIVDTRERFGDWEIDLVIGAGQQQALVTLIERRSRYVLMAHVPFKTAENVSQAIIKLLNPFRNACLHTITTDNGSEFVEHEHIAKTLNAKFFFAHPYSSWERGAIENANGLIRQYFPKTLSFSTITQERIKFATSRLNHRPRKCLRAKTPFQVLQAQLDSLDNPVALRT